MLGCVELVLPSLILSRTTRFVAIHSTWISAMAKSFETTPDLSIAKDAKLGSYRRVNCCWTFSATRRMGSLSSSCINWKPRTQSRCCLLLMFITADRHVRSKQNFAVTIGF
jgi:hypothetical protein